eukprot:10322937-Prorocentrum_lima.AAC.1
MQGVGVVASGLPYRHSAPRFVWQVNSFCSKAGGEAAQLADDIRRSLPLIQALRVWGAPFGRRSSVPATGGMLLPSYRRGTERVGL